MTDARERVVFDCNVCFQAFVSENGPAGRLLRAVHEGQFVLFLSKYVLDELRDVLSRPHIVEKFKFTEKRVAEYVDALSEMASLIDEVPHVFEFARDPKDAHYVDLAVAANAKLIVSRDKDLLSLRDATTTDGREFLNRFPMILILTPIEALQLISS